MRSTPLSVWLAFHALAACVYIVGCGSGGGSSSGSGAPITVSLASSTVVAPQDGTPASVGITIGSTSETAQVALVGLPAGVQQKYAFTDTNPSGTLTFTASSSSPAGTYQPTITVSSAGQTVSTQFTLVIAVVTSVSNSVDTNLGVKGKLEQFMATSFQLAEWDGNFFGTSTAAREAMLNNLNPQHIRIQPLSQAVPMQANTGAASDWNFTILDRTVQPILTSGDHSPEFQLATAPAWMCKSDGTFDVTNHTADFAAYAANLVRYYNKAGFTWGGEHFQSPSGLPITWWGIFNEYNINGLTVAEYTSLYNAVVPAMLAVDPTIHFSALEFSDFGLGTGNAGDPMQALPTFLGAASSGGVSTHADVLSTHLYGTCNQSDTDATLFATVPQFADNIRYFYSALQARPDLAATQVWVTENNVNADFAASNGMSTCNPTQVFVTDQRGTSAFFAAWRPYVFSQLGKVGNRALYHWDYTSDKQYGEVDSTGTAYLSYWVDRSLATLYPSTQASPGPDILTENSTDTSSIESLATRTSDGTVRVMVIDMAVHAATDNNGAGDPRTVIVDTSALGTFAAATVLTLDANTDLTKGPASIGLADSPRITINLNGYGVAILSLTP